jgi:hypothetical protein
MKALVASALLVALSGVPAIVEANPSRGPAMAIAEAPRRQPAQPAPVGAPPSDVSDYAAREATAPELGKFTGGGSGIYIGGSTVVVVLLIVLIVILI